MEKKRVGWLVGLVGEESWCAVGFVWMYVPVSAREGSLSADVGDFLALRLLLAKKVKYVKIVEVDAVNVAPSVNSSVIVNSDVIFIVNEIKALLKEVDDYKCHAISRLGNMLAHALASLAVSS
ncbi:hypothetical protein LWI29_014023 [Acer saccharum]|uniref:RNase H type-1 domain-containing protein n=1 Tax=Acer saccharum TaxID=4024 RepID=A0AA39TM21_ACESA|nr:hypothetical protein LWI29_014023 [Acer saccharum]